MFKFRVHAIPTHIREKLTEAADEEVALIKEYWRTFT